MDKVQASERAAVIGALVSRAGFARTLLSEVAKQEFAAASMMPEGLLFGLGANEVRDLIAYLMRPGQVPLPD